MSLTLTSAFTEKTVLKENWIFRLYYDDESASDFFGVSYYDTVMCAASLANPLTK